MLFPNSPWPVWQAYAGAFETGAGRFFATGAPLASLAGVRRCFRDRGRAFFRDRCLRGRCRTLLRRDDRGRCRALLRRDRGRSRCLRGRCWTLLRRDDRGRCRTLLRRDCAGIVVVVVVVVVVIVIVIV